jgi:hypothetical protein
MLLAIALFGLLNILHSSRPTAYSQTPHVYLLQYIYKFCIPIVIDVVFRFSVQSTLLEFINAFAKNVLTIAHQFTDCHC